MYIYIYSQRVQTENHKYLDSYHWTFIYSQWDVSVFQAPHFTTRAQTNLVAERRNMLKHGIIFQERNPRHPNTSWEGIWTPKTCLNTFLGGIWMYTGKPFLWICSNMLERPGFGNPKHSKFPKQTSKKGKMGRYFAHTHETTFNLHTPHACWCEHVYI